MHKHNIGEDKASKGLRIATNEESYIFHIVHIARLFLSGKIEVESSFAEDRPADFEVLRHSDHDAILIREGDRCIGRNIMSESYRLVRTWIDG